MIIGDDPPHHCPLSSKRDNTGDDEVSRASDDDKPVVVVIKTHPKKSLAIGPNRKVGSRQGHAPIIIPLSMELASKLTNPLLHKITKCNISYRKVTTTSYIDSFDPFLLD